MSIRLRSFNRRMKPQEDRRHATTTRAHGQTNNQQQDDHNDQGIRLAASPSPDSTRVPRRPLTHERRDLRFVHFVYFARIFSANRPGDPIVLNPQSKWRISPVIPSDMLDSKNAPVFPNSSFVMLRPKGDMPS